MELVIVLIDFADAIPEMHRKTSISDSLKQMILIIAGVLVIYLIVPNK